MHFPRSAGLLALTASIATSSPVSSPKTTTQATSTLPPKPLCTSSDMVNFETVDTAVPCYNPNNPLGFPPFDLGHFGTRKPPVVARQYQATETPTSSVITTWTSSETLVTPSGHPTHMTTSSGHSIAPFTHTASKSGHSVIHSTHIPSTTSFTPPATEEAMTTFTTKTKTPDSVVFLVECHEGLRGGCEDVSGQWVCCITTGSTPSATKEARWPGDVRHEGGHMMAKTKT